MHFIQVNYSICSYHETQTQDKTQAEPQDIDRSSCKSKIKEEIKESIVEILQEASCYPEKIVQQAKTSDS